MVCVCIAKIFYQKRSHQLRTSLVDENTDTLQSAERPYQKNTEGTNTKTKTKLLRQLTKSDINPKQPQHLKDMNPIFWQKKK